MSAAFVCGCGCGTPVTGIYCEATRARKAAERQQAKEQRSERMKEMWATRGDELRAAIAAGRAPAQEGA